MHKLEQDVRYPQEKILISVSGMFFIHLVSPERDGTCSSVEADDK